jgi:hypothetical protein
MENTFLIDLSIKYGLDSAQVSKLAAMVYQCGVEAIDSAEAKKIATYLCEKNLIEKPSEEVIEELKLNGFMEK